MPKHENVGVMYPEVTIFAGVTGISGSTVTGFTNRRGDVVSGSHVLSSSLRLGDGKPGNTGDFGTWQVAAGVYQDIFPTRWPNGGFKFVSHKLFVASGSAPVAARNKWADYSIIEEGQGLTGSSPMKPASGATTASYVQWAVISGTNPVPVDPPFDFSVSTLIFADKTNGTF